MASTGVWWDLMVCGSIVCVVCPAGCVFMCVVMTRSCVWRFLIDVCFVLCVLVCVQACGGGWLWQPRVHPRTRSTMPQGQCHNTHTHTALYLRAHRAHTKDTHKTHT